MGKTMTIGDILAIGQVKYNLNQRACMKNITTAKEASTYLSDVSEYHHRSLYCSLLYATQIIEDVANGLNTDYKGQRRVNVVLSQPRLNFPYRVRQHQNNNRVVDACKSWLHNHEDIQIMLASVLVVVGLWWLVRAVLALLINLVCPLLVLVMAVIMLASVLVVVRLWWLIQAVFALLINLVYPLLVVVLAVVCVPQLRAPLLGQNYPVVANLLRNIFLKIAETLKT